MLKVFRDEPPDNPDLLCSILRDAAAIFPELAELAAPIIDDDAELISADIEVQWAAVVLAADDKRRPEQRSGLKWRAGVHETISEAIATIANTPAKTERGADIKRQHAGRVAAMPDAPRSPFAAIEAIVVRDDGTLLMELSDGRYGIFQPIN